MSDPTPGAMKAATKCLDYLTDWDERDTPVSFSFQREKLASIIDSETGASTWAREREELVGALKELVEHLHGYGLPECLRLAKKRAEAALKAEGTEKS